MVDSVVYCLDDLSLPLWAVLLSVEHVIDVHRPVEELGPEPLQEHGVAVLTGEVDYDGFPRWTDVCADQERLRGLPLVLGSVGTDPNLVLGIGLWKEGEKRIKGG